MNMGLVCETRVLNKKNILVYQNVLFWGHRGRDCMVVGFTATYMQLVPITTDVTSLNLDQGEVYNIMS